MMLVNVFELVGQRALVSRGVARRIGSALRERVEKVRGVVPPALALDFSGVQAASPSFFDELVATLGELKEELGDTVTFLYPPPSVRGTFQAIGRGRGISFVETAPENWEVELTTTVGKAR